MLTVLLRSVLGIVILLGCDALAPVLLLPEEELLVFLKVLQAPQTLLTLLLEELGALLLLFFLQLGLFLLNYFACA